jgi:hypothetical protein
MKLPLSLESFADWLGTMPADEEYSPYEPLVCAIGRWLKATGFDRKTVEEKSWSLGEDPRFEHVIFCEPQTFGDAAKRARALLADAVTSAE